MYSRYSHRQNPPIRLPENYSGTAFKEATPSHPLPPKESPTPPRQLEIGKPTPPPDRPISDMPPPPRPVILPPKETVREEPQRALPTPISVSPKEEDDPHKDAPAPSSEERPVSAFLQPFQGLFGHMGNAFPFGHGMGFDELLIIGLIILLSRTEQESDVVLWLALLLFCG